MISLILTVRIYKNVEVFKGEAFLYYQFLM